MLDRGQVPRRAKSLHMLTLYLLVAEPGHELPTGPPPPLSCATDFRLLPHVPLLPCCRIKSTNVATTILTASRAARHTAKFGGSVSKNNKNYKNIIIKKYLLIIYDTFKILRVCTVTVVRQSDIL